MTTVATWIVAVARPRRHDRRRHEHPRRADHVWRLVDGRLFDAPGIVVEAHDLATFGQLPQAVRRPGPDRVCLDIVLGPGDAEAGFRLSCHGDAIQLVSPCAVLHVGAQPLISGGDGSGLLVRLIPDAPFGQVPPRVEEDADRNVVAIGER